MDTGHSQKHVTTWNYFGDLAQTDFLFGSSILSGYTMKTQTHYQISQFISTPATHHHETPLLRAAVRMEIYLLGLLCSDIIPGRRVLPGPTGTIGSQIHNL